MSIYVVGAGEPVIRRNVVTASAIAVLYVPLEMHQVNLQPLGQFHIMENLFWKVEEPVVRRYLANKTAKQRDEAIELPVNAGNRVEDPQVSFGPEQQVVLGPDSPARKLDLAGVMTVTLKSRWPLTDEERAMIPADGTRDWSKWKMKPR